jgi:hypothetical protein
MLGVACFDHLLPDELQILKIAAVISDFEEVGLI